jgi:hypothetical protein
MTTALAIIGGTAIILGAATKIPPAICALIRACIPLAAALHDLRNAISRSSNETTQERDRN